MDEIAQAVRHLEQYHHASDSQAKAVLKDKALPCLRKALSLAAPPAGPVTTQAGHAGGHFTPARGPDAGPPAAPDDEELGDLICADSPEECHCEEYVCEHDKALLARHCAAARAPLEAEVERLTKEHDEGGSDG